MICGLNGTRKKTQVIIDDLEFVACASFRKHRCSRFRSQRRFSTIVFALWCECSNVALRAGITW